MLTALGQAWDAAAVLRAVAMLAGGLLVLIAAVVLVRKWLIGRDEVDQAPGFTLADMRRLRDEGELSEQEYQRIRARLIGEARRGLDADDGDSQAPPRPSPPTDRGDDESEKRPGPD